MTSAPPEADRGTARRLIAQRETPGKIRELIDGFLAAGDTASAELHCEALTLIESARAEGFRTLIQLQRKNGNLPAALTAARQWSALAPRDAEAWRSLAETAYEAGAFAEAESAYLQVIRTDPSARGPVMEFFNLAFTNRPPSTIIEMLESLLHTEGLSAASRTLISYYITLLAEREARSQRGLPQVAGTAADWQNVFAAEEQKRWAEAAEAWFDERPITADAVTHFIDSKIRTAAPPVWKGLIDRWAGKARGTIVGTYCASDSHFDRLAGQSVADICAVLPPTHVVAETSSSLGPFVFVGCDQVYFDKYLPAMLGSLVELSATCGVHVHVFNSDDAALGRVFDKAAGRYRGQIRITGEHSDSAATNSANYFHIARFARMLEFLEGGTDPAWLFDADLMFRRNPAPLLEGLRTHDVGLSLDAGRFEIRNQIRAGMVGIAASPLGRTYLRMTAAYLVDVWKSGRLVWGADQIALYFVLRRLLEFHPDVRILAGLPLMDRFEEGTSYLFWTKPAPGDINADKLAATREAAFKRLGL